MAGGLSAAAGGGGAGGRGEACTWGPPARPAASISPPGCWGACPGSPAPQPWGAPCGSRQPPVLDLHGRRRGADGALRRDLASVAPAAEVKGRLLFSAKPCTLLGAGTPSPAGPSSRRGSHLNEFEEPVMLYGPLRRPVPGPAGPGPVGEALCHRLHPPGGGPGIPAGLVELRTVHNYGAAWSSFSGQRWLLVAVTAVIVLAWSAVLLRRVVRQSLGVAAGFLILSGGVGKHHRPGAAGLCGGYVPPEFWPSYPTFNVADICVGVRGRAGGRLLLMVLREIRQGRQGPWRRGRSK